ncbi:MAG: tRNA (adenosine(37)-N6)-threonylcarbamoyltransferase complex ATPase subunit type 1 TsaE [Candidatus Omnitrophica bacterium]|nr:tRNA (adenosine(37)-N6)-threonylcarbamoyltransferase complex ATPase subunit type 1 TsaE [Candidatus Omnitrophota bacterium]
MKKVSFNSNSVNDTINLAKKIARSLSKGSVVGLFGDLGSGKTTFVKGLAKGLGLTARINSPSFVILKVYSLKIKISKNKTAASLYHFDLYRLKSLKELEDTGFEDFVNDNGISIIEWADKAGKLLPKDYLKIKIRVKNENSRIIDIIACGDRYLNLIKHIK